MWRSGDASSTASSEGKSGRYQRSAELEKVYNICRHLEQVHLPQVKLAIRALKDQAKAADLAASAAGMLADTVTFIDENPFVSEEEVREENYAVTAEDDAAKSSIVNGDKEDAENGQVLSEESESPLFSALRIRQGCSDTTGRF